MPLLTDLTQTRSRILVAAAALGVALMAASAAQAFTFENQTTPGGASQNFSGTDSRFSTGTNNGNSSSPVRPGFNSGNGSLRFNAQPSFNQRYNSERMFDSSGLLGK
jgi:opacity protein-like surface antigen